MADFELNWKYKDFEIRAAHTYGKNPTPYIELIMWDECDGERDCFTLAYFRRGKDGDWELHFVGDRPMEYIAEIDISPIWKQLWLIQKMFLDAERKAGDD